MNKDDISNSFCVVLNSSNVYSSYNSIYKYNFIQGGFNVPEDSKICVSQITIPYSWFNVNAQVYNNAQFAIQYPTPASNTYTTYTITLPNGFYQTTDINSFLQKQMIQLGLYLVSTTAGGPNLYFFNISTNINYYTNQILTFLVPSTTTNLATLYPGYRVPTVADGGAAWIYGAGPTFYTTASPVTTVFQVLSSSPAFGTLIGYLAGSYPSTVITSNTANYSTLGNTQPNATPVNSLILRCNLIANTVTVPSDILDSVPIQGATFGANINYSPSYEKWVDMVAGNYTNLSLTLQDQNFNQLQANDNNVLLVLYIKLGTKKKLLSYAGDKKITG